MLAGLLPLLVGVLVLPFACALVLFLLVVLHGRTLLFGEAAGKNVVGQLGHV